MNPCPQTIANIDEILGYIKLKRASGQPDTGRAQCELDGPWPPNAGDKRPTPEQLKDRYPGPYAIVRRSKFKFASGPTVRCDGPLKYEVCKYLRHIQILMNGAVLDEYDSPDPYEVEDLVGVCPTEAIKSLLGASNLLKYLLAADIPTGKIGASSDNEVLANLTQAFSATAYRSPKCTFIVPPVISRQAFIEIAYLASAQGTELRIKELPSIESGWASLDTIVSDLSSTKFKLGTDLKNIMEELASTQVRSSGGITTDEVWVIEATAAIHSKTQRGC